MKQYDFEQGWTAPVGPSKKEHHRVYQKRWRGSNMDKHYGWTSTWKKKNGETRKKIDRRSQRKRLYKITDKEWDEMFEAQEKRCAICETEDFGKSGPHTDHCHKTGRFRGILCHWCNHMLGNARDVAWV